MTVLTEALAAFFGFALVAIMTENIVFARSLGVSRLLKLVDDDGVDTLLFCTLLTIIQMITVPFAYLMRDPFRTLGDLRYYIRPLFYVAVSCVAFFLIYAFVHFLIKGARGKFIKDTLPMAAFNCSVFGTMYISGTSFESIIHAFGYAFGSSIGYFLAALLVTEGQRIIFKKEVPSVLQGLPIMLIYVGILALAIYGFSGHSVI